MSAIQDRIAMTPLPLFILLGMIFVGIYYSVSYDDGQVLEAEVATNTEELNKVQTEIEAAKQVVAEKVKFEHEVSQIGGQLQAALEYLPNKLRIDEVLKILSSEARAAGINLNRVEPIAKPDVKDFYEELSVNISAEGGFNQITTFLASITRMQRIVGLKNLSLRFKRQDAEGVVLDMSGVFIAFRYVEKTP